ncbi:MAG: sortase [Candidatus Roizmanbacteria bacterium]|nr:sortase [Candidatus Roizmanbacteria bacterium]
MHVYLKENTSKKRKAINYISYFTLGMGVLLLFWSFYPVLSFELYSRFILKNGVESPVPQNGAGAARDTQSVLGSSDALSSNLKDFTQAHLWFPGKQSDEQKLTTGVQQYTLTIPKLNITKARVVVGGDDLTKSLVHYVPRSMPGEFGNVAIFGHSTLPQLYNEKDYKTIFTYLPSLQKGDSILVAVGDLEYEYEVYDMFVVSPEKVSVLDQQYDASYLTLVTCVPPGTFWKRLVIKAKLIRLP